MINLSYIWTPQRRVPEVNYELIHSPNEMKQGLLSDHKYEYIKPRSINWWDWHCEICNAPISPRP